MLIVRAHSHKWEQVTPGIFDMHSHLGVDSVPELTGESIPAFHSGINIIERCWWCQLLERSCSTLAKKSWWSKYSRRSLPLVHFRRCDHFPHPAWLRKCNWYGIYARNIYHLTCIQGGQAFAIKLRPTAERSPSSMVLEPPFSMNSSASSPLLPHRWRHMKYAGTPNWRIGK